MDYYQKQQFIAQVDKDDHLIRKIDKWQAHKDNILHRGFTVCLFYKGDALLQHRKHPVFDGVYDLTFSSHPVYENENLQSMEDAVYASLAREWNISKHDLKKPLKDKGSVYYNAHDTKSGFWEHELCHLFVSELIGLPDLNFDYAYGFSLIPKKTLQNSRIPIASSFAPWVSSLLKIL